MNPVPAFFLTWAIEKMLDGFVEKIRDKFDNNSTLIDQYEKALKESTTIFFSKYGDTYGGSKKASFLSSKKNIERIYNALFDEDTNPTKTIYETNGYGIKPEIVHQGILNFITILKNKILEYPELNHYRISINTNRNTDTILDEIGTVKQQTVAGIAGINDIKQLLMEQSNRTEENKDKVLLEEINKKIEEGNYNDALKMIDKILIDIKNPKVQEQLLSKKGTIYFNMGNREGIKDSLEKLTALNANTTEKYQFFVIISINDEDENLFNKSVENLIKNGVENDKLVAYKAEWCIARHNPQEAIELLTENNVIKKEYIDSCTVNDMLGQAYLLIGNYNDGIKHLNIAQEIKYHWFRDYMVHRFKAIIILNKGRYAASSDSNLQLICNNILKYKQYFNLLSIPHKIEYYQILFACLIGFNQKKIIDIYIDLDERIKENLDIKLLYADALSDVGRFTEAIEVYSELGSKYHDEEMYLHFLAGLSAESQYRKIISIYNSIDWSETKDSKGKLISIFLEAYIMLNDFITAHEIVEREFDTNKDKVFFLFEAAEVYYLNKNKQKANQVIKIAIGKLTDVDYSPRILFAKICANIEMIDEAIQILEPYIIFSEYAKKRWLNYRANQAFLSNNYILAKKINEEIYELEPNDDAAHNIVQAASLCGEQINDIKIINHIRKSDNPYSLAALAQYEWTVQKNFNEAETLFFKSLKELKDQVDENIYLGFIHFIYLYHDREQHNQIKEKCAIHLTNSDSRLWICFDNDLDIKKDESLNFVGCEHFSHLSITFKEFIAKKRGQEVSFKRSKYIIDDIVDRKIISVNYIREKFIETYPNHPHLQLVKIDEDYPVKNMIPILLENNRAVKEALDFYNFSNRIGLPINGLSQLVGRDYQKTILSLLGTSEQLFFSYDIAHPELQNTKILLSNSSLHILAFFNLYNDIDTTQLYITRSLKSYIKKCFDEAIEDKSLATISVDDNGLPQLFKQTEEVKQSRIEFTRALDLFVEKLNIVDDSMLIIPNNEALHVIGDIDFRSLITSENEKIILIMDDLFVARVGKGLLKYNIEVTNIVDLIINQNLSITRELEIINQLAEAGYTKLYDSIILLNWVIRLADQKIILNDNEKRLINIIHKSFEIKYIDIKEYYLRNTIGALDYLYAKIINPTIQKYMKLLAKEIQNLHIDLRTAIMQAFQLDVSKQEFFLNLFEID